MWFDLNKSGQGDEEGSVFVTFLWASYINDPQTWYYIFNIPPKKYFSTFAILSTCVTDL